MKIKQLDPITISQIAAGEVIDRPVSMIKELIENAIDANATMITIYTIDGGKKRIKITDNGHGISKEDLPIAALPHSTSKISEFDDIYKTLSFGFRGEALSSICHIAQLTLTSKTQNTQNAYQITAQNTTFSAVAQAAHPQGTTIDIKYIFESLPVRKKFLKSAVTEKSYIIDLIIKFSVLFPEIDFCYIDDDKEIINSGGIPNQLDLIALFYGQEHLPHLLPVNFNQGPVTINGIISDPSTSFSNKNKQLFSINKRLIKSSIIQKAVFQSYQDLLPSKRFPLTILDISLPTNQCDVNIHPQKQDIKFINPQLLFQAIPKAISHAMHYQSIDLSKTIQNTPQKTTFSTPPPQKPTLQNTPFQINPNHQTISRPSPPAPIPEPEQITLSPAPITFEYLQLFSTYLAIKTPEALYLLDQHAVHERILYEQLKTNPKQRESQPLLIAEHIDLSKEQWAQFESKKYFFKSLNMIIEPFGETQIIIREVPVIFANIQLKEWIFELLDQESENIALTEMLTEKEKLQMKACKAAIKAGKKLYPEEVKSLIQSFLKTPSNFTCPHGRPLCITYDKKALEKLFKRI